jgi:hypothetical protein
MPRLSCVFSVPGRLLRISALLLLGGLTVASGLAGCDAGDIDIVTTPPETFTTETQALACVGGPKFDPSGEKNVGNGKGQQFIGGQCLSSKDCGSGCCALPCGICSGVGAQFQAGKQGCGFGDGRAPVPAPPAANPAPPPPAPAPMVGAACMGGPKFDPAGEKNVGNGKGQQFIGGQCLNAKDCASGCCAFPCGICSGVGAQFQAGKQGCGFGDRRAP